MPRGAWKGLSPEEKLARRRASMAAARSHVNNPELRQQTAQGPEAKQAAKVKSRRNVHREAIVWVARKLPEKRVENMAGLVPPSPIARNLFLWANLSEENNHKFWTQLYPKVIEKEQPPEEKKAFEDDHRTMFRLFDMWEAERPKPKPCPHCGKFPQESVNGSESVVVPSANVPRADPVPSADCAAQVQAGCGLERKDQEVPVPDSAHPAVG